MTIIVVAVLVRDGAASTALAIVNGFTLITSLALAIYAHYGWDARLYDDRLPSVRTVSGRRTVDLARLAKVGRLEISGNRGTVDDSLILTDIHGVRVMVKRLKHNEESLEAVIRRTLLTMPVNSKVVVSTRAAERTGLMSVMGRFHPNLIQGRRYSEVRAFALQMLLMVVVIPVASIVIVIIGLLAASA
ncbi:hypothetical protein [Streptomyces boninensis]|uniref:hypothetical protein n=1 Tax=Streptomyces boninensis TaxID=2039455 RepID=UPI003B211975